MEDDLFSRSAYNSSRNTRSGKDGLFWWAIVILILLGTVIASWMGSFYVFGHPENPTSYEFLTKLGKIEELKRFELTAAPTGEFLSAEQLYDRFSPMSDFELKQANDVFLRNYIRNYKGVKEKLPYVIGRYSIIDSLELHEKDIFQKGAVVLAKSIDLPAVLIEHVYSCPPETVPVLQRLLMTGLDLKLERTLDLSTIIHVEKLTDGRLQITLVPLLYGTYAMAQSTGTFSLEPPDSLNLRAPLPIIQGDDFLDAEKRYAALRKGSTQASSILLKPMPADKAGEEKRMPAPALSRATPRPKPTATPGVEIATALAALGRTPATAAPAEAPSPAPVPGPAASLTPPLPSPVAASTAAREVPLAPAVPDDTPLAANPAATASGVELKPFLASAATPSIPKPSATAWRTYGPGQMPRGRLVDVRSAPELAGQANSGERLYLQGEFTVSAASEGRAVLKPRSGLAGRVVGLARGSGDVRVIVEYPPTSSSPEQGSSVERGADRPFQITSIRRDSDGQIIVYAREITTP